MERKILIIEDDELVRNLLTEFLLKKGFHVSTAGNGRDGLKIASLEHPELIVLDIMLPEEDGFAFMQKVRALSEWGKQVPFFVFSNLELDDNQYKEQLDRLQPATSLIKANWSIQDVAKKIEEQLLKMA